MKITAKSHKSIIPIVTAGLGLAALGTGIGLALADPTLAMLSAGTSNLSMVLSITGSAMFLASVFAFYRVAYADELFIGKNVVETESDQTTLLYVSDPLFSISIGCDMMALSAFAVLVAVSVGIAYGGMHLGIGSILPATWSAGASLAMQAGISFIGGSILGALILSGIYAIGAENSSLLDQIKEKRITIGFSALAIGLLGAAATVAGPALTAAMGAAAANTAEAIALEALIAVSIMSLFGVILKGIDVIDAQRKGTEAMNASRDFRDTGEL